MTAAAPALLRCGWSREWCCIYFGFNRRTVGPIRSMSGNGDTSAIAPLKAHGRIPAKIDNTAGTRLCLGWA